MMQNPHNYRYAGFGVRLVASIIDTIFVCIIIVPILLHFYGTEYFISSDLQQSIYSGSIKNILASYQPIHGIWDFIFSYVFPAVAIMIFWMYRSATPGKMMMSLKIIDAKTGNAPSKQQCLIRYLGYYVSAIPFCLGFFWVLFHPQKQGWHDLIAGTYVVYSK